MTVSRFLLLCAIICFVLAALGIPAGVNLVALGLALFAAGHFS